MSDFPLIDKGYVYLDSASTSQKPKRVIEAEKKYYESTNANVHRGIYKISEEATRLYEEAHRKVADFINADGMEEIIFTRNTTESLNLLAYSLGSKLKRGDEILLTRMEHHSNIVPWQQVAKRTGAKIRFIEIKKDGTLAWEPALVTEKTKIISVCHASNVLGIVNPVEDIGKHKKNAVFIIDGAQSVPHMPVDVKKINCDFLAFSSHKMLGPTGVGILYGRRDLLENMEPFLFGGDMISEVSYEDAEWNDLPWKFEAGTPNIAGGIAFGAAIDYLKKKGMKLIEKQEAELTKYAMKKLKQTGAEIYGPEKRIGVISFNIPEIPSHDLAYLLGKDNICIRSGHHCAMPLMGLLGIESCARMSFYLYNRKSDIDKAIKSIEKAKKIFRVRK